MNNRAFCLVYHRGKAPATRHLNKKLQLFQRRESEKEAKKTGLDNGREMVI